MSDPLRVGIVGAGIVGLAHAWSAARRGHQVTVFERSAAASGASVRNFGMIWPIGQPSGAAHAVAMRSREAWLELAREGVVWVNPCGSLHLAHRADEWNVLEEFAAKSQGLGYNCELLSRDAVLARTAAANPVGLLGGLASSSELCVNPRTAIAALPGWLSSQYGATFQWNMAITEIDSGSVRSASGRRWAFDKILVCGGSDFETLFPEIFAASGLKRCKLQMLKTMPQPKGWNLGPHLASGLTLRHYANFEVCDSLAALRNRVAAETPELDRYGIHVMASQNDLGELILGDSHEYDASIERFDKAEIDNLMLRELRKVLCLPDWTIVERWHGVYAKHSSRTCFEAEPVPRVHICTGTGGSGMTMSFGLAEQWWSTDS